MISKIVLKKYIIKCDNVIANKDTHAAELLQNEIISVFENHIENLKEGLSNCSTLDMMPFDDCFACVDVAIDFIGDIKKLKNKLLLELNKIENVQKSSKNFSSMQNVIYISHSPNDEKYAIILIDFLTSIGVNPNCIFSSSAEGYSVPFNEDKYEYITKKLKRNNTFVIFLLSSKYYGNVACNNEAGALWILRKEFVSFFLPGFKYDENEYKGAINPKKALIDLNENESKIKVKLNDLKQLIINHVAINDISLTNWERYRNNFINQICNTNPLQESDYREVYLKLKKSNTNITINSVASLGYDRNTARIILEELVIQKFLEKADFGIYKIIN